LLTQVGIEFESDELVIPIVGVTTKDSLLIRSISGLNPPDPNLFIGDYSRDGGIYQGRRVGNRNIVMLMDLNPNPALDETVSGLRELLYKTFMDPLVDADDVKMNFYNEDDDVRYAVGYAEKFETDIFGQEATVQVSMICPDPYLRDDNETLLSHPTGWSTVPFAYAGSAETGFQVKIYIDAPTPVLTLENNGKTMVITRGFSAGEVVTINTIRGSRSLTVTSPPSTTPVSIAANLAVTSPWLDLHSQANTMKVYGTAPVNLVASIRELRYTQSYWGI
jgi:tail protein